MATTIIFYILAAIILICAFLAVTTKRIMRAATYLLFVLFGTAGLYFLMGFTFLGSVQVMVYAGGVVVLYIFALMLTERQGTNEKSSISLAKKIIALMASLGGAAIILFVILTHKFLDAVLSAPNEQLISVKSLGQQILASGKYGYLLPFETVSVLLLACIIAGLIIARKR
jgi:NADH-quinone oxidoreductase subunit J